MTFFLFHIFDFEHIRTQLCCPLKDVAISIQNSVLLLAFEVKVSPEQTTEHEEVLELPLL